jgi:hypothetical protein
MPGADCRRLVSEFGFVLVELSAVEDDALWRGTLSALGRLTLLALQHARRGEAFLQVLHERMLPLIAEVLAAPSGVAALAQVVRYTLLVNEVVQPADLERTLAAALGPGAAEGVMTAGED